MLVKINFIIFLSEDFKQITSLPHCDLESKIPAPWLYRCKQNKEANKIWKQL